MVLFKQKNKPTNSEIPVHHKDSGPREQTYRLRRRSSFLFCILFVLLILYFLR